MKLDATMYGAWPNLASMVFGIAREQGEAPLFQNVGDPFPLSWKETADQSAALAAGLVEIGVRPGDRVALLAPNGAAWAIADIAVMALGGISVPIYTTHSARDCAAILEHSGAKAVITATLERRRHPLEECPPARGLSIIGLDDAIVDRLRRGASPVHRHQRLVERGAAGGENIRRQKISGEQSCCLIYTSGTTGEPRAAELSHRAILANCRGAFDLLEPVISRHERFLSFLPLSHSYERTAGLYFPLSIRARIFYARGIDTLAEDLRRSRPTLMTAVPRLYENLRGKMLARRRRMPKWRARLFDATLALGEKRISGRSRTLRERGIDALLDRLVRRRIRAGFGGQLKAMVSGGAALDPRIEGFFHSLGLRILQGYGQTEAGPIISCNRFDRNRIGTVGPPLDGIDVRLSRAGEILVRSPAVMKGYWRDRRASAKVLRRGWLHTGDIGRIDQGFLTILGRNREILVTSGGDNVSCQKVENALLFADAIHQAVVFGDRRPWLGAIIVAEPSPIGGSGKARRKALAAAIDAINHTLTPTERIRKFILSSDPFTIENGLLTPTLKPRRNRILQRFQSQIDALYR